MITLRSKLTGKLVIASDNESVIKDFIIGRYNKALEYLKLNSQFPKVNIDCFDVAFNDFQKDIDTYKVNVVIWHTAYKAFNCVCPASHMQKKVDRAETKEHVIERTN